MILCFNCSILRITSFLFSYLKIFEISKLYPYPKITENRNMCLQLFGGPHGSVCRGRPIRVRPLSRVGEVAGAPINFTFGGLDVVFLDRLQRLPQSGPLHTCRGYSLTPKHTPVLPTSSPTVRQC
jgi:hypothetical protein